MAETSVIAQVFDTILSTPGMGETVKIDLRISRKNVLLLSSVIDRGLSEKGGEKGGGILGNIPQDTLAELKTISDECLEKAGLIALNEKLKGLG